MWLRSLLPSIKVALISEHSCTWVVVQALAIRPKEAIRALGLVEFIVHFRWRTEMVALLLRPGIFVKNFLDIMCLI